MSIGQPSFVERLRIALEQGISEDHGFTKTLLEKALEKAKEHYEGLLAIVDVKREVSLAEETLKRAKVEYAVLTSKMAEIEDEYLDMLTAVIYMDDRTIVQFWLEDKGLVVPQVLVRDTGPALLDQIYQEYIKLWRERLVGEMNDSCSEAGTQNSIVQKLDEIEAKRRLDIRFLDTEVIAGLVEGITNRQGRVTIDEACRCFRRAKVLSVYTETPRELIVESALCSVSKSLTLSTGRIRRYRTIIVHEGKIL